MFHPRNGSEIARYKTAMCRFRESRGYWNKGEKCKFAHSQSEKRRYSDAIPKWVKKLYSDCDSDSDLDSDSDSGHEEIKYNSSRRSGLSNQGRSSNILNMLRDSKGGMNSLYKEKLDEKSAECLRLLSDNLDLKKMMAKYKNEYNMKINKMKAERDKFEEIARKNWDAHRKLHQKTIDRKEQSAWAGPSEYEKLFSSTLEKFENMLKWPISLDTLEEPMILPSGNTVNKSVMETLIQNYKTDPYDREKRCTQLVSNRFASETAEIINEAQKEKESSDVLEVGTSASTQTDDIWNEIQTDPEIIQKHQEFDVEDPKSNESITRLVKILKVSEEQSNLNSEEIASLTMRWDSLVDQITTCTDKLDEVLERCRLKFLTFVIRLIKEDNFSLPVCDEPTNMSDQIDWVVKWMTLIENKIQKVRKIRFVKRKTICASIEEEEKLNEIELIEDETSEVSLHP